MVSLPLLTVIIFNFCLTFFLINRYGNLAKQNVLITISVFIAWFFSFNVIFILPLDITSTIYNQCTIKHVHNQTESSTAIPLLPTTISVPFELTNSTHIINLNISAKQNNLKNVNDSLLPSLSSNNNTTNNNKTSNTTNNLEDVCSKPWSYVSKNVLLNLWKFIYWSSQLLTWIILPIFQSYSMSGEFTTVKKIESSLKENLKYYCLFSILFLLFLIYYASKERVTFEGLKVFCISASNTFGLFLLVILMGYGLVDIPRNFLKNYHCNYQYKLHYLYFKIGKINEEKYQANCHLEDLLDELRACYTKVYGENRYRYLQKQLQMIIVKCPDSFKEDLSKLELINNVANDENSDFDLNEKYLVNLNAKIKRALQSSYRTEVQYRMLIQQASELEDIIKDLSSSYKSVDDLANVSATERWLRKNIPKAEFLFQHKNVAVYKICFLIIGFIFTFFSVIIVWSEFTFSIKAIPLSIFALIIKIIDQDYFWIEVFSMLSIAYLSSCCYYTIFKIRIFDYYYLAKHHQTDEYSLIFSGMLLCRLASPLCLNFLSLIHFDSHVSNESIEEETAFTQIMGHMDTVSYISDYIFIYLPLFMSIFCVATLFKLDSKISSFFGFEQYSLFDDISQELVREGEKLLKRELRKQQQQHHHSHHQASSQAASSHKNVVVCDRNSNLSRTASREKLLGNQHLNLQQQQQTPNNEQNAIIVDLDKNLFDDI